MAKKQHLEHLDRGVDYWNQWRESNPKVRPNLVAAELTGRDFQGIDLSDAILIDVDLSDADLEDGNLSGADLSGAKLVDVDLTGARLVNAELSGADLRRADLTKANLTEASLRNANLYQAVLINANLNKADLSEASLESANLSCAILTRANLEDADLDDANLEDADLHNANLMDASFIGSNLEDADLTGADMRGAFLNKAKLIDAELGGADLSQARLVNADLSGANLSNARLIGTKLQSANLSGCHVYGISAWGLDINGARQENLLITPRGEARITVDDLEVAQFIYLIVRNEKLRKVIDTIATKAVLILGRFTDERKLILNAIRDLLRARGYLPILFDFEEPENRNVTETVTTLARLSRFIVADLTSPRSIPQELQAIVPQLPSVPVQPILSGTEREYGMFADLQDYEWVLPVCQYDDLADLTAQFDSSVISPAETKAAEMIGKRRR